MIFSVLGSDGHDIDFNFLNLWRRGIMKSGICAVGKKTHLGSKGLMVFLLYRILSLKPVVFSWFVFWNVRCFGFTLRISAPLNRKVHPSTTYMFHIVLFVFFGGLLISLLTSFLEKPYRVILFPCFM